MSEVVMYATLFCPYCMRARRLLKSKGVSIKELRVDGDNKLWKVMEKRSGRNTVPQIFIDDRHIGGYDDLARINQNGELDKLLYD
ncbi:MAG: Glutaredoxin 3 (Grx3) [uncultured Thiotrichaceae bacterium]|uniref:Glutaredoxin n=1 Tax=uncultured Thiotrichaceae bacterium TaxID=298394 RepID=A0A6S6TZI5_9GAMM|nr:MAG: Glutaredoxin 3 (Grx3) [uncultured Thiotrichaceae bacterium]